MRRRMKQKNVDEPTPEIINEVLLLLRVLFEEHGKNMSKDYMLPEPTGQLSMERREVAEELDYNQDDLAQVADINESNLNAEQLIAYRVLKHMVDSKSGGLVALEATGKFSI